ncbi:MAG: 1-(5-phosphoribosyl)-5-[(5-phosphoribosylamino)methylideneamino]imidazole-4-carboxamide isomerase [Bacteroidales bacterium]
MITPVPAIDILGGKCVRLSRGDFSSSKIYGDPLEMAMQFEDHGITRLHMVDLDGAREQHVINHRVVEKVAGRTGLRIDAGGGIRTDEDVRILFESGVHMITGGSMAVRDQELFLGWLELYGPDRILLGADFREGHIAIAGWNEKTTIDLMEFIATYHALGIRKVICTDIDRDGMLEGPAVSTYTEIRRLHPSLFIVASGGISGMDDIMALQEAGLNEVIVGKAIYEKRISLKELESFIINQQR